MRRWFTASEAETRRVGTELAVELAPDGVLLVHGDLGAGKTVLARGVAEALGIDPAEVQSPTFIVMREHEGTGPEVGRLVHVDLYRLDADETAAAGVEEVLAGPGVKVVEWAERLPYAPPGALRLRIERRGDTVREIHELV
jgi:tRNA threonylcarbamoyladenosine biosynthesis protein TsaE